MTFKEFLRVLTFNLLTATLGYGAYSLVKMLHSPEGLSNLKLPFVGTLNFSSLSVLISSNGASDSKAFFDVVLCFTIVLALSALGYHLLRLIGIRRTSEVSSGECTICILGYLIILAVVAFFGLKITDFKGFENTILILIPIPLFGLTYLLKLYNQNQEPKRTAQQYYRSNKHRRFKRR